MKNKSSWLLALAISSFVVYYVSVLVGYPQNHFLVISSVWTAATVLNESEGNDE